MAKDEFIRIINSPHVIEVIAERFDDALELAGKNALVYGGALRDIIADLPMGGDLDIVISYHSYHGAVSNFQASAKWTRVGRNGRAQVPRIAPIKKSKGGPPMSSASTRYKPSFGRPIAGLKDPYKEADIPMVETVSFETFDCARVQLIQAVPDFGSEHNDPLKVPLDLARDADIRCCSIAMNCLGKVFELVDGAYIDCKEKVLVANKVKNPNRFNNLKERVEKLKLRGWKSQINFKKVDSEIKKQKEKLKKKEKLQQRSAPATAGPLDPRLGFNVFADRERGGYTVQIEKELKHILVRPLEMIIESVRKEQYIRLKEVPSSHPRWLSYNSPELSDIQKLGAYMQRFLDNRKMKHASKSMHDKGDVATWKTAKPKSNWEAYKAGVSAAEEFMEEIVAQVASDPAELISASLVEPAVTPAKYNVYIEPPTLTDVEIAQKARLTARSISKAKKKSKKAKKAKTKGR